MLHKTAIDVYKTFRCPPERATEATTRPKACDLLYLPCSGSTGVWVDGGPGRVGGLWARGMHGASGPASSPPSSFGGVLGALPDPLAPSRLKLVEPGWGGLDGRSF